MRNNNQYREAQHLFKGEFCLIVYRNGHSDRIQLSVFTDTDCCFATRSGVRFCFIKTIGPAI